MNAAYSYKVHADPILFTESCFAGKLNYVDFLATGSGDQIRWRVEFSRVKPIFHGLSFEKDFDFDSIVQHLMNGASIDLPGRYQLADLVKMDAPIVSE